MYLLARVRKAWLADRERGHLRIDGALDNASSAKLACGLSPLKFLRRMEEFQRRPGAAPLERGRAR